MRLNKGKLGELKAKELWPDLILTESGGIDDKNGIDGYLHGERVQIKYDGTISRTGNVYIELYEKSIGHIDQEWRTSKVNADIYIFVTINKAYLFSVNELVGALKILSDNNELICRAISETSIGFLMPLNKINGVEKSIKRGINESRIN